MEQALPFDVRNASSESFNILMEQFDAFYRNRAIVQYYGVPLTSRKVGWKIIALEFDGHFIDLAIDGQDGYLSAFREGGQQGAPWYHFRECVPDGLEGNKIKLSSESGYGALFKGTMLLDAGKEVLVDCCYQVLGFLNAHRNDNAIPEAGINLTDDQARALARLAGMFCEPTLFRSVRNFVSLCMDKWNSSRFSNKLLLRIKNWSHICRYAMHCLSIEIKDSENFDPEELKLVEHLMIKSLEDTVGPNGELLLILCRDYEKQGQGFVRG